jgi:hypothetical protein
MPEDMRAAVSELVDLVYERNDWGTDELELKVDEISVLFSVVCHAGFEPEAVVPGLIRPIDRDDDGSALGYGPAINPHCRHKVVCENGRDNEIATGWLDAIVGNILTTTGFAVYGEHRQQCREAAINMVAKMVEESVPLKPIQLNALGDYLCEPNPNYRSTFGSSVFFAQHTRDTSELPVGNNIGVHGICSGRFGRHRTTKDFDAIVCPVCCLRVSIPASIGTYGDLRRHRSILLVEKP